MIDILSEIYLFLESHIDESLMSFVFVAGFGYGLWYGPEDKRIVDAAIGTYPKTQREAVEWVPLHALEWSASSSADKAAHRLAGRRFFLWGLPKLGGMQKTTRSAARRIRMNLWVTLLAVALLGLKTTVWILPISLCILLFVVFKTPPWPKQEGYIL
ncbi:hypothetical protein [Pseudophaeobacter sp.]|uniref:hypothetical protein n=1 Tax=Pseudophaeobacter sp. TaxID=1971739 RepID=UPI003298E84C